MTRQTSPARWGRSGRAWLVIHRLLLPDVTHRLMQAKLLGLPGTAVCYRLCRQQRCVCTCHLLGGHFAATNRHALNAKRLVRTVMLALQAAAALLLAAQDSSCEDTLLAGILQGTGGTAVLGGQQAAAAAAEQASPGKQVLVSTVSDAGTPTTSEWQQLFGSLVATAASGSTAATLCWTL
jgi:hypothetical protein